jgi:hypothetical protein
MCSVSVQYVSSPNVSNRKILCPSARTLGFSGVPPFAKSGFNSDGDTAAAGPSSVVQAAMPATIAARTMLNECFRTPEADTLENIKLSCHS